MTRYRFTNAMGGEWVNTPRPDRNRVRTNGARFERPKGEPSWIVGVAITSAIFSILAIGWSLLP